MNYQVFRQIVKNLNLTLKSISLELYNRLILNSKDLQIILDSVSHVLQSPIFLFT